MINKKIKNEILLKEINSLNVEIDGGSLICLDCNSKHIGYEIPNSDIRCSITDVDTRTQIKKIIEERIKACIDSINEFEFLLNNEKNRMAIMLKDDDISVENFIYYKEDIIKANKIDQEFYKIDAEIEKIKTKLSTIDEKSSTNKLSKKELINRVLSKMNEFYILFEPDDPIQITSLFTLTTSNYSSSQGTLFLLSRIFALNNIYINSHPIIVDYFRGGEISTIKEETILDEFIKMDRQVFLTCTLKDEEYGKYDNIEFVNSISFDGVEKFHILSTEYNEVVNEVLSALFIEI